jgi:hypothetical protein
MLSLVDLGSEPKLLDVIHGPAPVGAGMVGRRWLYRLVFDELKSLNMGRQGTSLAGGEDLEAIFIAHRLGCEIWYDPALHVQHYIPKARVTDQYWDKWMIDTTRCHAWLLRLSGAEAGRTNLAYFRKWVWLRLLVIKYTLLGLLPAGVHPAVARAPFWRHFYVSMARGYRGLIENRAYVRRVFEIIEAQRRGGRPVKEPV